MVKLLQALAWAIKVDDAANARVSSKSEMRDFNGASRSHVFDGAGSSALLVTCGRVVAEVFVLLQGHSSEVN